MVSFLLLCRSMSCKLRMVEPDVTYEIVTGTVDRQRLFRPNGHLKTPLLHESCSTDALDPKNDAHPKPSILNITGFAFARAMELYPIQLHAVEQNISHIHSNITVNNEQLKNLSMFFKVAHSHIAREVNRLYEREGHLFAGRLRATSCEDDESAEDKLIYSMTNVIKDGFVDRQTGKVFLSAYPSLAKGKKMKFWKIDWNRFHKKGGYRVKSHRPKDYIIWREIECSWLASYLNWPLEKRQTRLRKEVAKKTDAIAKQLLAEGKTPMSIKRLKKIDPRSKPNEPRNSTPQPQCHASTVEAADKFKERKRQFINKYVPASADFRSGNHQREFPKGSYRPPLMNICTGDST